MASLEIRQLKHLAFALGVSLTEIADAAASVEKHYEQLLLIDPRHPDKQRVVVDVRGPIRRLQYRLYTRVLLPKLTPSAESHGGVRGRSIKTNVTPHLKSTYVLKLDISNFFPSVHHTRIYRLFSEGLECSPDVSRILTRLCTYKHHLALGLITSPILADQILKRVDRRITAACRQIGLVYTRFVDDITISGPFAFDNGTVIKVIQAALKKDGFNCSAHKSVFGVLDDNVSITGIRVRDGKMDSTREYNAELDRQLTDLESLSKGGEFDGPYFTKSQILGRIHFVCWINPWRQRALTRRFRSIRWSKVESEARARNLVVCRPTLTRVSKDQ